MAPPRQRPAPATAAAAAATSAAANAVIPDDSRSEASSTRERQGTTKGRKPAATSSAAANTTVAGMNAALKEGKSPAADQRMDESGSVESQASVCGFPKYNIDNTPRPNLTAAIDKLVHYASVCPSRIPLRLQPILPKRVLITDKLHPPLAGCRSAICNRHFHPTQTIAPAAGIGQTTSGHAG